MTIGHFSLESALTVVGNVLRGRESKNLVDFDLAEGLSVDTFSKGEGQLLSF